MMRKFYITTVWLIYVLSCLLPHNVFAKTENEETTRTTPQITLVQLHIHDHLTWPIFRAIAENDKKTAYKETKNLIDQTREPIVQHALTFLAATLAFDLGDFTKAEKLLKLSLKQSNVLEIYIRYYMAKTLNAQSKHQKALAQIDKVEKQLTGKIKQDFYWEKINTLIGLQKWELADNLLDLSIKKKNVKEDEVNEVQFYHGKIAWFKGEKRKSMDIWKKLLIAKAGNPFEIKIFNIILENKRDLKALFTDQDWMARADALVKNGSPSRAVLIYKKLAGKGHELDRKIADAYFTAKKYAEASVYYKNLMQSNNGNNLELMVALATSYARSDQFEEAIKLNKKIIKKFPTTREAAISKMKLRFLYFDSGQYEKSQKAYTKVLEKKKISRREANSAMWFQLWSNYLRKDYQSALRNIELVLTQKFNKDDRRKFSYWQARILDKIGSKKQAELILKRLYQDQATDYYGLLARQRVMKKKLDKHSLIEVPTITRVPKGVEPTLTSKDNDISIPLNDSLTRSICLGQIGFASYAYEESMNSEVLKGTLRPQEQAPSLLLAKNFTRLFVLGKRLNNQRPQAETWSMSYPKAYVQIVDYFAQKIGVSRKIIWAIMRQESAYKPAVVSPARAMGLMQIIPPTAREIADALGRPNFQLEQLFNPLVNIEFGAWYFRERLKQFDNVLPYAIASYNAGPRAAARWKRWGDNLELDEFVELIPYKETNGYVKKVLHNFWIYSKLYGDEPLTTKSNEK